MLRNHKKNNHKKDKVQEFQCDECEYKCSKRDTQEPKEETDTKVKTKQKK